MLLKSIKLNNIRSYEDEKISFPDGSLLLSGDIGSGKSTILLAIEFCFFGFRPKVLDGATLLRHGKKEGSVELKLDIDKKEVIIKRTIKRGNRSIGQSSGYMIREGKKKELTAVELKAEVLNLLGYPRNILTKSKDLIYRYTVYTPQEEMKTIITDDPDSRLDVLRKVFNIDKYRKIKDNSSVYIRVLKDRAKFLEGKSTGIEERKQQKKERLKEIEEFDIRIKARKPKHEAIKSEITLKKKNIERFEKDLKKLAGLKKDLELQNLSLKMRIEQRQRNAAEIGRLSKAIEEIRKDSQAISNEREDILKKETISKGNSVKLLESTIRKLGQDIAGFTISKKNAAEIRSKITSLDKCPTCEQEVKKEYKEAIINREDRKIKDNEESLDIYRKQMKRSEDELVKLRQDIEKLRKESAAIELNRLKIKNLNENIKQEENLAKSQEDIKAEVGKINQKKLSIQKDLSEYSNIEELYSELRKKLDKIQIDERKLALDINSLEKDKSGLQMLASSIDKEIDEKTRALDKLNQIRHMIEWIDQYFIKLVTIIEKHVLSSIYNEFDSHFREWFNILIEDENLQVRLDDQFTPMVVQNGYDAAIGNLSGGEKTSIALSYRLALNKVINDLIPTIKTGDIIILDEPTDGFSSNQLDKVREILDQLTNRQTIIVSHESKIETFVDYVVRIAKTEHVSRVFS